MAKAPARRSTKRLSAAEVESIFSAFESDNPEPRGELVATNAFTLLVAGPKATEASLKDQIPLVLDAFQPFLRELRPEDLAGSAAVFRIKEELLTRTRDALGDGMVDDILIQDLIQQ